MSGGHDGRGRGGPRPLAAAAALGAAAALLLTGCLAGGADGDREQRTDTITDEIAQQLRAQPGVSEVEVGYYDYATDPHNATADLTVAPDADVDTIVDEATRRIWLSRLDPLSSISVWISHPGDRTPRQTYLWTVVDPAGDDYADLADRYGPRPAAREGD